MTIEHLNLRSSSSFFLTNPMDQPTTTRKVMGIALFILLTLATVGIYACAVFFLHLRGRVTSSNTEAPSSLSLPTPGSLLTSGDILLANVPVPCVANASSSNRSFTPLRATAADGSPLSLGSYIDGRFVYNEDLYLDTTTTNLLSMLDEMLSYFFGDARHGRVPLQRFAPLWNTIPGTERGAYTIFVCRMLVQTIDGVLFGEAQMAGSLVLFAGRFVTAVLQEASSPPVDDRTGVVISTDTGYNGGFREHVAGIAGAASVNCSDNVVMSVDDAHLIWLLHAPCSESLTPGQLLPLTVAQRRREMVHTEVATFVKVHGHRDPLEAELSVRHSLNVDLKLRLLSENNHFARSAMAPAEITRIGNHILEATETREAQLAIFYRSPVWQGRLRKMFPDRFREAEEAFDGNPSNDSSVDAIPGEAETYPELMVRMARIKEDRERLVADVTRQITEELGLVPPAE